MSKVMINLDVDLALNITSVLDEMLVDCPHDIGMEVVDRLKLRYSRANQIEQETINVKSVNISKSRELTKSCTKEVIDYVEALERSLEQQKQVTNQAIKKIKELSTEKTETGGVLGRLDKNKPDKAERAPEYNNVPVDTNEIDKVLKPDKINKVVKSSEKEILDAVKLIMRECDKNSDCEKTCNAPMLENGECMFDFAPSTWGLPR